MSFLLTDKIKITGMSSSVPAESVETKSFPLFSEMDFLNFSKTTGVERRRKANDDTCSSDLCRVAAEKLIGELNWNKKEIDCLIFVTQTPDYIIPATSAILQHQLGLSDNCYTLDISLGCSGWVYGLSVIASLLSKGTMKKGLLLSGDTILKFCSPNDKSTYPLFGDAGSATALEFTGKAEDEIKFSFNTQGSGYKTIMIEDGGYRNPVSEKSFVNESISPGINRTKLDLILEGMDVFSFGISKAPKSVLDLVAYFNIDIDKIDYFTFHQANKFMNEKIRKKLKLPENKVPYSLKNFGNTSCATIPLTLVTEISKELTEQKLTHIACGFGVGLSWGSVCFDTDKIVVPKLIEYE